MASAATLKVDFLGDLNDLTKKFRSATTQMESFANRINRIGKQMSVALTAPITAFAGVSVRAFAKQEDAERKLASAIRATGGQVDANMARFTAFATEMQRLTVVGDETTLGLLQLATAQGLSADASERAVRNAIAMQSAFNVGAESAIRMTAALEQGDATMLRRYIPALRGVTDEAEMLAKAHEILSGAFEIAQDEALTFGGQVAQLRNAFGDFQEQVGAVIAKGLGPFVRRAQLMVEQLQAMDEATLKARVQMGLFVAAIGPALIVFSKLATAFLALMTPLTAKIALFAALGAGIVVVYQNAQQLSERFVYYFSVAKDAVLGMVASALEALGRLVSYVDAVAGAALLGLGASVGGLRDEMDRPEFTEFVGFLEAMGNVASGVGAKFTAMWDSILERVDPGVKAMSDMATETERFASGIERATVAGQTFSGSMANISEVTLPNMSEGIEWVSYEMQFLQSVADTFVNSFGQGMANLIVQGGKFVDVLENMGRLLASAAIQKAITIFLSGGLEGSGFFGSGGGLFGALFGRATGGQVGRGQPYMVGERGPELFVPGANGFVAPNNAISGMGASVNVTGTFRIQGTDLIATIERAKRSFR
jgi:hypothetical protein